MSKLKILSLVLNFVYFKRIDFVNNLNQSTITYKNQSQQRIYVNGYFYILFYYLKS